MTNTKSWRDSLPVHEAAKIFEPNTDKDFTGDVATHGIIQPVTLWRDHKHAPNSLVDGQSRLDALEKSGHEITIENVDRPSGYEVTIWYSGKGGCGFVPTKHIRGDEYNGTVYDLVVSCNINRRQLTAEDKQKAIAALLKLDPTKSNRQIAKQTKTSHPHVAKVREQLEKAGNVETVTTSIDTKSRKQPARKAKAADQKSAARKSPVAQVSLDEAVNKINQLWDEADELEQQIASEKTTSDYAAGIEEVRALAMERDIVEVLNVLAGELWTDHDARRVADVIVRHIGLLNASKLALALDDLRYGTETDEVEQEPEVAKPPEMPAPPIVDDEPPSGDLLEMPDFLRRVPVH